MRARPCSPAKVILTWCLRQSSAGMLSCDQNHVMNCVACTLCRKVVRRAALKQHGKRTLAHGPLRMPSDNASCRRPASYPHSHEWPMRGKRIGEANHPGPQPEHRSSSSPPEVRRHRLRSKQAEPMIESLAQPSDWCGRTGAECSLATCACRIGWG